LFPWAEWVSSVAEQVDLPAAAVQCLARRGQRDPEDFLAAWRAKTPADRQLFWSTLAAAPDDDLLGALAALAVEQGSWNTMAAALHPLGDRLIPLILRLAPAARWPGVLFVAGSSDALSAIGQVAVQWAALVPAVPIAVAVSPAVWDQYLAAAPESRTKAILREGEIAVAGIEPTWIEWTLNEAGAIASVAATLAAVGADAALVGAAVSLVRATVAPPTSQADEDRARSAAERFLFAFLESLPETAGRFELNAVLDFRFGPRSAEVDLLCRSPRVAIELDGYFHFLAPEGYRRDRAKDWELQRRGYVVLRFLAEDVIPQLEVIRDRITAALTLTPFGGYP